MLKSIAKKFNEWYTDQVFQQLYDGKPLEEIDIKLQLTTLKPLHAQWVVELFNHMTTDEGKEVILNGWKASGITEALKRGLNQLSSIDPYQDIDPLLTSFEGECNIAEFLQIPEEERQAMGFGNMVADTDDEDDDIFEPTRSFNDVFNSFSTEE